jgi:putative membrane protein
LLRWWRFWRLCIRRSKPLPGTLPAPCNRPEMASAVPVTLVLLVTAFVYMRGWVHLWRTLPGVLPAWHLAAFLGGLFVIWVAIASPLSALDDELLTVHMVQHLLLMTVAAPLLLAGAPAVTMLHGLPQPAVRRGLGPFLRWPPLQRLGHGLTHPVVCWLAGAGAVMLWHVPALFELGLRFERWHEIEHACFLAAGLLFWWPLIQPWPSVARWPRWSAPLYLFLATLPCDALSAFLAFCDRVVYPSYLTSPGRFDISPLHDQQLAGTLMWVWVTFAYLAPAVVITIQILSPRRVATLERARPGRNQETP